MKSVAFVLFQILADENQVLGDIHCRIDIVFLSDLKERLIVTLLHPNQKQLILIHDCTLKAEAVKTSIHDINRLFGSFLHQLQRCFALILMRKFLDNDICEKLVVHIVAGNRVRTGTLAIW